MPNGKNAFYFYMCEYEEKMKAWGKTYPEGKRQIATEAGPAWRMLSHEERLKYEELAKEYRATEKKNLSNKFTTTGISFAQLEQERIDKDEHEKKMLEEIKSHVANLSLNSLKAKKFYFCHFNFYCRGPKEDYIPCEMAVCQFSLLNGIENTFHTFINPGEIPVGFTYEADKISNETHLIPLPPLTGKSSDFADVLKQLKTFISAKNGKIPPLFAVPPHVEISKNILGNICSQSGEANYLFTIYPFTLMFFHLRKECAKIAGNSTGFPALSIVEKELERDIFNFTRGIACSFHNKVDAMQYCSLSIVKRWGYTIADHCCKDLSVELIPGKHIPFHADVNRRKGGQQHIEQKFVKKGSNSSPFSDSTDNFPQATNSFLKKMSITPARRKGEEHEDQANKYKTMQVFV